jgi:Cytochrome P460
MNTKPLLTLVIAVAIFGSLATARHPQSSTVSASTTNAPVFTSDGQLQLPAYYREWVYLTTGFDMSYSAKQNADHHMFDNVFVNPEAYQSFVKTGTWPDKTMIVLEVRGAKSKGSINQAGNFQDSDIMGLEVHIKDTSRFKDQGNWAFFGFDGEAVPAPRADPYANNSAAKTPANSTSKMTPATANCYSCHAQHAAVDTTFVQFYPTLLPIAKTHSTLSPSYLKDPAIPAEK